MNADALALAYKILERSLLAYILIAYRIVRVAPAEILRLA